MATYPFVQVDAFTKTPFSGNPCAVVFDGDRLSDEQRQHIAFEMNLAETAFIVTPTQGDVGARYFTPAEEIPLAGHPTIAVIHALFATGRLRRPDGLHVISLELRDGPIRIEVRVEQGAATEIVMSQRKPEFLRTYGAAEVAPIFGLAPEDLRQDAPIQTVSTGTPQLFVPVKSIQALRTAVVDVAAYRELRVQGDFFSPHLFVTEGVTSDGSTFARHFGVPPDIAEDPFTGSATGGMAAYCYRYGLIAVTRFTAQQGHWLGRPGSASVEVVGTKMDIETVKVGGNAVLVLRGEILLPG